MSRMEDQLDLPCGCVVGVVDDTFVLQSCPDAEECKWVQYIMMEANAADKPVAVLDWRDDG